LPASAKSRTKYRPTTTLSAAIAAATTSGLTPNVPATATKFTAPPTCLAQSAAATEGASAPRDLRGSREKARTVPSAVEREPSRKAGSRARPEVSRERREPLKSSRGTESGTRWDVAKE
jgi:hypothetical protein